MERAFNPSGKTVVIQATPDKSPAVLIPSDISDVNQYRIVNAGLVMVFVSFNEVKSVAESSLAIPTVDQPASSIPIFPGAVEILTGPDESYLAAITPTASAMLYITPGRGL